MDSSSNFDRTLELLGQADVLRHLDRASLEALASPGRHEALGRGQYLPGPDAPAEVYVVLAGRVRLLWLTPDGHELTLDRRCAGKLVPIGTDGSDPPDSTLAVADADRTRDFHFDADRFMDVTMRQPGAARELAMLQRRHIREQYRARADLAFAPLPERLYRLLRLLSAASEDGCVTETHEDLARMIGASRERVTRALAKLRDDGLISFVPCGHRIRVLD